MLRRFGTILLVLFALSAFSSRAFAQSWSFDARTIGMGGVGAGNLATKMIDSERNYTAIVIPIGLFQVLSDTDVFDPNNKKFDPILAVEYAATPFAYVVGRGSSSNPGETAFVNDVRNANLSNIKFSKYKGFVPASDILAEGLVSPDFGFTIKVHKGERGSFQGIYIGAGPYLAMHSQSNIDPKLIDVLTTGVDKPNTTFNLSEADEGQGALAITGGYRGRFAWPEGVGSGSDRDGLYVAANYNYLKGFGYTNDTLAVGLLTDNNSVVTGASNINVHHEDATSGTGMALDVGVGAVIGPWEFGGGIRGLANHITWTGAEQKTLTLQNLTSGNSNFVEGPTTAIGDVRVELKKDYRGNIGYYGEGFAVIADVGDGFGGSSFHGGVEKKLGAIDVRGGARYTVSKWNPTFGVGFNLGKTVSIDVAAFGTTANIEQKHETAIAASIRFNHMKK
jgi:hypothetical protein